MTETKVFECHECEAHCILKIENCGETYTHGTCIADTHQTCWTELKVK